MGREYNVCQIMVTVAKYSMTVTVMVTTRTLIDLLFFLVFIYTTFLGLEDIQFWFIL